MKSIVLTLPLAGHVTGVRTGTGNRARLSGDENNIVTPPSLQHMMFWAQAKYTKATSEVLSFDLQAGTAEVRVTAEPDSWVDALEAFVSGKPPEALAVAAQRVDVTAPQPDYESGIPAEADPVESRFKLEVDPGVRNG